MPKIEVALIVLGYDAKWLEYRFIDEQFLQQQLARFRTSGDHCGEHYRYAAFLKVLADRPMLDDLALAHYVELAALDQDRVMAKSALIRLVKWSGLTESQRAWLRGHPALAAPVVQRAFDRLPSSGTSSRGGRLRVQRNRSQ
jgi:Arc/MetJ family transcription regulator